MYQQFFYCNWAIKLDLNEVNCNGDRRRLRGTFSIQCGPRPLESTVLGMTDI